MEKLELTAATAKETTEIGRALGTLLSAGDVITLAGELGAGKTTFTQGIALGLGVTRRVTSPTFTLMKNYQGRLPLNHIDAYRLEDINQDLGFDEFMEADGVTVIEWAGFIASILPVERLNVDFFMNDDGSRRLCFTAVGTEYQEVLDRLCTLLD
ncbi:MAG: tRNA (adenosine(37)-N6)-threonylcarbamoyltransferase complex ATPase subunit type 1 TsaE [Erysipelotrichaceae bacterium]|nr:tRNA (adenosine(37)-N6)-threonylcarbamoyltransferase complex ATPase subunit type 1 TsaE [Erysipelotrichaceae bacterium]